MPVQPGAGTGLAARQATSAHHGRLRRRGRRLHVASEVLPVVAVRGSVSLKTVTAWVYNDGGRRAAGFRGDTGDCAARAVAIAAEIPYRDVYDRLNDLAKFESPRGRGRMSSARTGVHRQTYDALLDELGFEWVPTMTIGSGCRVHLCAEELPSGRIVARLSRHVCAVVNGVVHDTHDPTRDGTRCVYGYWWR